MITGIPRPEMAPGAWKVSFAETELLSPNNGVLDLKASYSVAEVKIGHTALVIGLVADQSDFPAVSLSFEGVDRAHVDLDQIRQAIAGDLGFLEIRLVDFDSDRLGFLVEMDFGQVSVDCLRFEISFAAG